VAIETLDYFNSILFLVFFSFIHQQNGAFYRLGTQIACSKMKGLAFLWPCLDLQSCFPSCLGMIQFSMTPLVIHFAESTHIDANIDSMLLVIGNPTNVVLIKSSFTLFLILPCVCTAIAGFLSLFIQFRSKQYIPK
jgi:Na+/H+ antiporter NhaD/arsenite permease-like protein